jgi:hypothetical protein
MLSNSGRYSFPENHQKQKMTFLMKITFTVFEIEQKRPGQFTFLNMLRDRNTCAYMILSRFPP